MSDFFNAYKAGNRDSQRSDEQLSDMEFTERLLEEFAAEEEMVRYAEHLPLVRRSLQSDFISHVDSWDNRNEQLRRLPMTLAVMLVACVVFLSGSRDRSETNKVTEPTQAVRYEMHPQRAIRFERGRIQAAIQDTDSWAIVEAFQLDRLQHSRMLRGLGQVSSLD